MASNHPRSQSEPNAQRSQASPAEDSTSLLRPDSIVEYDLPEPHEEIDFDTPINSADDSSDSSYMAQIIAEESPNDLPSTPEFDQDDELFGDIDPNSLESSHNPTVEPGQVEFQENDGTISSSSIFGTPADAVAPTPSVDGLIRSAERSDDNTDVRNSLFSELPNSDRMKQGSGEDSNSVRIRFDELESNATGSGSLLSDLLSETGIGEYTGHDLDDDDGNAVEFKPFEEEEINPEESIFGEKTIEPADDAPRYKPTHSSDSIQWGTKPDIDDMDSFLNLDDETQRSDSIPGMDLSADNSTPITRLPIESRRSPNDTSRNHQTVRNNAPTLIATPSSTRTMRSGWPIGLALGLLLSFGIAAIASVAGYLNFATSTQSAVVPDDSTRALLAQATTQRDAAQSQAEELQATLAALQNDVKNRTAEARRLETRQAALVRALEHKNLVPQGTDVASAWSKLPTLIEKLSRETQLSQQQAMQSQLTQTRQAEQTAQQQARTLNQQLVAATTRLNESQRQLDDSKTMANQLETELAKLQADLETAGLSKDDKAMLEQLNKTRADLSQTRQAESDARKQADTFAQQLQTTNMELQESRTTLTSLQNQAQELETKLKNAQSDLAQTERSLTQRYNQLQSDYEQMLERKDAEMARKLADVRAGSPVAFTSAEREAQDQAETEYGEGVSYYHSGRHGLAASRFEAATQSHAGDARYWYYLGLSRLMLGQTSEANAALKTGAEWERRNQPASHVINAALERIQGSQRQQLSNQRP